MATRRQTNKKKDPKIVWSSQESFQGQISHIAEKFFEQLDEKLSPHVFILCAPAEGNKKAEVVLIREDECGYETSLFSNILVKAAEWYEEAEARQLGGRFPPTEVDRRRLESFQRAVEKVLSASDTQRGIISYSSTPVNFNDYKVFCILQLNANAVKSHYALPEVKERGMARLPKSLIDAAAVEYLSTCLKILRERNPGGNWQTEHMEDEILLSAARELTSRAAAAGCNAPLRFTFDLLTAISLSSYEGAKAKGKMRIVSYDHWDLKTEVQFLQPVEMRKSVTTQEARAARKMVEMANQKVDLLFNGYQIYGLGRVKVNYDERNGEIYTVEFPGNHGWLLKHRDKVLMKVQYDRPSLPSEPLKKTVFEDHVERIFKGKTKVNLEKLWKIAETAADQKHGTMIVISSGAKSEAARLAKQSTMIKPVNILGDRLLAVTSIDGAVLIDPTGKCYAVGVILDGMASEEGTPARGARFNSAIRYVSTKTGGHQCLILVISEDGTIDLVPKLEPKIRRSELEGYVERLRAIKESETVNIRELLRVMRWIGLHKFYLLPETCQRVNELKNAISARPNVGLSWADFTPNETMDESYFID